MLEDNILRLTQDISELNSRFVLGKISINDYNEAVEDMQDNSRGRRLYVMSLAADMSANKIVKSLKFSAKHRTLTTSLNFCTSR